MPLARERLTRAGLRRPAGIGARAQPGRRARAGRRPWRCDWCGGARPRRRRFYGGAVQREEPGVLAALAEPPVGVGVADDLVRAEGELAVGEAALEVLQAVARPNAAAEVEGDAELGGELDHRLDDVLERGVAEVSFGGATEVVVEDPVRERRDRRPPRWLPRGCGRATARSARSRGSCRSTPARTSSARPPPPAAWSPCRRRGSSSAARPRSRARAAPRPGSRACGCGGSARRSASAGSAVAMGRAPGRRSARSPPPGRAPRRAARGRRRSPARCPTSRSRPDRGARRAPRARPRPDTRMARSRRTSPVSAISRTSSGSAIAEPRALDPQRVGDALGVVEGAGAEEVVRLAPPSPGRRPARRAGGSRSAISSARPESR